MSLKYLKSSSWVTLCYTLSGTLGKILSFFMLPYFLGAISLQEFGIWDWYHGWSVSLVILGSGLSIIAMPRFVALYTHEQQKNAISNCIYAGGIASSLIVLIGFAFMARTFSLYLVYTTGIVCLSIPFNILLSYCSSLQYVWYYSALCLVHHTLTLSLTTLLFWQGYATLSLFAGHCIALLMFLPLFIVLFWHYNRPNKAIAYQQLLYSFPIIIHCFVYTLFCMIDRSVIHQWCSPTDLGSYALLLRFAALFHTVALSITNAWPALCFEAHNHPASKNEVAQLIMYFSLFLWIGYFVTCIGTAIGTQLFFKRYLFVVGYMPLFLLNSLLLSLAQLYTVGGSINNTTSYLPFLTTATALCQYLLLWLFKPMSLHNINLINCIPFFLYLVSNIAMSTYYVPTSINIRKICILHAVSALWVVIISVLLSYQWHIMSLIAVVSIWLIIVIILFFREEIRYIKKIVLERCIRTLSAVFKKPSPKKNIKNILFLRTDICDDISAQCGGASAQTLGIIKGLQDNGITVHMASYSMYSVLHNYPSIYFTHLKVWPWRTNTKQESTQSLNTHHTISEIRAILGFIKWRIACLISNITFLIQLRSIFKEHSIDAVYQSYTVLNITGLLAKLIWRVPVIIEYNSLEVWIYKRANVYSWFRFDRLAYCIESITQQSADCLVVVSQTLKDSLSQQLKEINHILVQPNGVCTDTYDPALFVEDRTIIRNTLAINDKCVVGYTSTFSHWHGIELLHTLLTEACKQLPRIHFILIGDGPSYESLQSMIYSSEIIASHVTLTGYISHDQNKRYLSACDLYLCSAVPIINGVKNFCSPIKLFEYMSMQKPIIAAGVEQIATCMLYANDRLLEQSDSGIVVNAPYQGDDFLRALTTMMNASDEQRTLWGANARQKAINHFTWKARIRTIINFIGHKD